MSDSEIYGLVRRNALRWYAAEIRRFCELSHGVPQGVRFACINRAKSLAKDCHKFYCLA